MQLSGLSPRSLEDTAHAFTSWDSCMANVPCKVIAIAGITIGALIILWILIAIIRCCQCGISTLSACCFCCCSDRHHSMEAPKFRYSQPPPSRGGGAGGGYEPTFEPVYHTSSSGFGGNARESVASFTNAPAHAPLNVPPPRTATPTSTMKKPSPPPEYNEEWGYFGDRNDRRPWESSTRKIDNSESMEMEPYNHQHPYAHHERDVSNSTTAFIQPVNNFPMHQPHPPPPQGPPPAGSSIMAMPPVQPQPPGGPYRQPMPPQPSPYDNPYDNPMNHYDNYPQQYQPHHNQYQPPHF